MGSDRERGKKKKKKNIAHTFAATGLSSCFFPPAHKQHGTAVASQFVSPRLGCLQSSSLLSSRSILCFWTLSFFRQRVVDFVFLPPWFEHSDAAVPLVPVLAETTFDRQGSDASSTTSRQNDRKRQSPGPHRHRKKEAGIWPLFLISAAKNLSNNRWYCCRRTEATSIRFHRFFPFDARCLYSLSGSSAVRRVPSSHQNNPPFFGSPAQSPADSEEKTSRFN